VFRFVKPLLAPLALTASLFFLADVPAAAQYRHDRTFYQAHGGFRPAYRLDYRYPSIVQSPYFYYSPIVRSSYYYSYPSVVVPPYYSYSYPLAPLYAPYAVPVQPLPYGYGYWVPYW